MNDTRELLERVGGRFAFPDEAFERLERRRDRKRRNRRIGAGALAIIVAIVSFVALTRAFRTTERPADESPKPPGIFSEAGGWIAYGNEQGIWAVDPSHRGDPNSQIQLSTEPGTPLAWSSDGSKLLILSYERPGSSVPNRLYVLNADGTETTLTTDCLYCIEGASFSPDGSQVIYSNDVPDNNPPGSVDNAHRSIYVVDTRGGAPRVLLTGGRRSFPRTGRSHISGLANPTYSPDGTQVAYFDQQFVGPSQLRVVNADGSGTRILLLRRGYMTYNLAWSPDGERLAWEGYEGIYVVGADGSGLTLAIPDGTDPYWSPDGTRIAYRIYQGGRQSTCPSCEIGTLEIAALDGTHVQEFPSADPGPWNPLVQPELAEVGQGLGASEGSTLTSTLLFVVALMALTAMAILIRRRLEGRSRPQSGSASKPGE